MRRTPLRRTKPLRQWPLRPGQGPRRRTPLQRRTPAASSRALSAAPAQREKVTGRACLICGSVARVDPAHVIPRSLGGCGEPDCVVPLCRGHHRAYDRGELDLLPYLEPQWRRELAHAVLHIGLVGALRRITGSRPPVAVDDS